jgi:hypothetical protein
MICTYKPNDSVNFTSHKTMLLREICNFATLSFDFLLLCHLVSMTGGTIYVYDLWAR